MLIDGGHILVTLNVTKIRCFYFFCDCKKEKRKNKTKKYDW